MKNINKIYKHNLNLTEVRTREEDKSLGTMMSILTGKGKENFSGKKTRIKLVPMFGNIDQLN